MLVQVNNEEMGSPVDAAKSYMQARPPWASPSTNNFEFKSPSPLGLQLFKEETSYSISGNPLSSSRVTFYPLNYTHDAFPHHFSYVTFFYLSTTVSRRHEAQFIYVF